MTANAFAAARERERRLTDLEELIPGLVSAVNEQLEADRAAVIKAATEQHAYVVEADNMTTERMLAADAALSARIAAFYTMTFGQRLRWLLGI